MECPKFLKGVEADRFLFLLEAGYPFEDALRMVNDAKLFEEAQEKILKELLQARGDKWLLEQLETQYSTYGLEFRLTFIQYSGLGNSAEDSLKFAERRANTRVSFWKGERAIMPPNIKECPTDTKLVICSTNRLAINDEQFQLLMGKLWKPIKKITDLNEMPNIVGYHFVPDPGYIRVICTDKPTAQYVITVLSRVDTWPNASLCIMNEKKYLESQIFSVVLPNAPSEKLPRILKNLEKQNPGLEPMKWTILTRRPLPEQPLFEKEQLHILIPREGDGAAIERAGFELNYKSGKVKLTIPDACVVPNNRVTFAGDFPDSNRLSIEDIFKIIEQLNEHLCTDAWSAVKRKKYRGDMRKFYTDQQSAEQLKQMGYEINYKSGKVKLTPLKPLMEYRKTENPTEEVIEID